MEAVQGHRWQQVELDRRINEMKPENAEMLQELLGIVRKQREEEEQNRTYTWLEHCNINFWKFRDKYPGLITGLQEELDITVWDEVAEKLGLTYQQIERCRKCHRGSFTREVFNTLAMNPQNRDLTLKEVLMVLLHLERHDILRRLQGFDCLVTTESCTPKTFTLSIQRQGEVLVAAENHGFTSRKDGISGKQSCFIARVLVIHAHDAKEDALKLANQLRNSASKERRLNVLLLQESANSTVKSWLEIDPWNSIYKWFMRVDVVVPVLSPQFLHQIQNRDSSAATEQEKRYNRYVYRMMLDQFVEHGSKNYSCHAVCPARFQREVTKSELVRFNGLFISNWNCSSEKEVEEYVQILHRRAKTFRMLKKKWKREQLQTGHENEVGNEVNCKEN